MTSTSSPSRTSSLEESATQIPASPAAKRRHRVAPLPRGRLGWLTGLLSWTLLGASTIFWCLMLMPFALLKLALPMRAVRKRLDPCLNWIATQWISTHTGWFAGIQRTAWDVQGNTGLRYDDWYLVNCNHQSWVDIFVLQHTLNRRIPLLKFFLKQQLIYVPVIGLAWWALDFPFMKRHGKAQLRRNPALRRQDQETARRACAKFSLVPTSVMVFAEGTRFTEAKRQQQASPYRHLLKPKAGGLAVTLNAMGDRFRSMIDVTIAYPDGIPTFWQLACGRAGRIIVRMHSIPVPAAFCQADYTGDSAFRADFHHWLADQWEAKDREIEALTGNAPDAPPPAAPR